MVQLGGEKCLEKNYYKCGCTEEAGAAGPHNHIHDHNEASSIFAGGTHLEIS